ncbi:TIGR03915 family putative DNA repair protein [Aquimarina sp. U1-2]|uniref:TIGR03915 family putative DNA repair protein n=1 Tax=Aquimarina sp. U1-2 TaxID=2823141 RepID=UPI001AECE495|nr:TIGR03915 family putative DNA repair protein [Aquimarina sp. U1-2]MBP2832447.1 TIGR03915 family putative DNA repair protein [Aquimarina sp. U1-2]
MNPQTILLYDGTFDGFLTCVFTVYDQNISDVVIQHYHLDHNQLFSVIEDVITQKHLAHRVWKGFKEKTTKNEQNDFFKAFLSEIKGVENTLLSYMRSIFNRKSIKTIDFSNKDILKISQVARMVAREKHRMEAFVRFQLTKDEIYVATVAPDFNVLPLIIKHFRDRYADQKWLIFDTSRNYGIFYNLKTVEMIRFEDKKGLDPKCISKNHNLQESNFQELWNVYYKNVNISSRNNKKLHEQHLPKRYWKYLTEKNGM